MLLSVTDVSNEKKDGFAIGIDLGTTNSLISYVDKEGQPHIINDDLGNRLIKSIVTYTKSGKVKVGHEEEGSILRSTKRYIGKQKKFQLFDRQVLPEDVASEILLYLKGLAEKQLSRPVHKAVITVPAYFDEVARNATKKAAEMAGLEVLRLINEPTAAALAYAVDSKKQGVFAVYDLGGGTFDVSILRLKNGVFQVLATGGNTNLGGDDIDKNIARYFMHNINKWPQDLDINAILLSRKIKESLSSSDAIDVDMQGESTTITRDDITLCAQPVIEKTMRIFRATIDNAEIEDNELDGIILVGGSTRMPQIKEAIKNTYSTNIYDDLNPDEIVAIGAALQAHALTVGSDNLLLDVTPLSLGIETMGGVMEVLIPRNTTIPAQESQKFTTFQDSQTAIKINILQGERETADKCRSIGQFEIKNIPPMPAGKAIVNIIFTLDADGLMSISAHEETTGQTQHIEIKPYYDLSQEETYEIIRQGMENAREDINRRLLIEARVDAQRLVNAAKSSLHKFSHLIKNEQKFEIEGAVKSVEESQKSTNREEMESAAKMLENACEPLLEAQVNFAASMSIKGRKINELEKQINA